MTQANVQKRKNNDKPGPESPRPPPPQIQTIMAVVVPVEIFDQMKRAVKQNPDEDVELLIQAMRNLQPQQVNMQMPPGQAPGQ